MSCSNNTISTKRRFLRLHQFSYKRFILAGLLLAGLLSGCSFDEPVMPSWNIELNVPFADENFEIGEALLNDSTIIAEGADSLVQISFEGSLDAIEISAADFTLPEIDTTVGFEFGIIELNGLAELSTGALSLRTIFPDLESLVVPGATVEVTMPDTTLVPAPIVINADDFEALHIVDGNMQMTFANNMPFPIGPNAETPNGMQIQMTDNNGRSIVLLEFNQVIGPGETVQVSEPLAANEWLYAPIRVDYIVPIAQPTVVQLDDRALDQSTVQIDAGMQDLRVDQAIARISAQNYENRSAFVLDNENRLREAVLDRGAVQLNFNNDTELNTTINFNLPNIKNVAGEAYTGNLDLPARQSAVVNIDLRDMRIAHSTVPGNFVDSLEFSYQASVQATENIINLNATDGVTVAVSVNELAMRAFSGYVSNETFEIDPIQQDDLVDFDDFPSNIELSSVDLALRLQNEVFIENLLIDLEIVGYHREDGVITDSARLVLNNQQIQPGQPGNPVESVIALSGAEVADFLNILPTSVRTSGRASASGNVEVLQNSAVAGSYEFSTPLRFRIDGDAVIEGDVETLAVEDIDEDILDADDERFGSASIALRLTNATPLSGSVRLLVSIDPDRQDMYDSTYFNPSMEFIKEVELSGAETDPFTGYVSNPSQGDIVLNLTREEFRLFQNPPVRIAYELRVNGTNTVVAVRSTDYVGIAGLATVNLLVGGED